MIHQSVDLNNNATATWMHQTENYQLNSKNPKCPIAKINFHLVVPLFMVPFQVPPWLPLMHERLRPAPEQRPISILALRSQRGVFTWNIGNKQLVWILCIYIYTGKGAFKLKLDWMRSHARFLLINDRRENKTRQRLALMMK